MNKQEVTTPMFTDAQVLGKMEETILTQLAELEREASVIKGKLEVLYSIRDNLTYYRKIEK